MIKTKIRMFNISSVNATNGSFKSSISVTLPDLSFHHQNINNIYIMVDHCEIPNSFYIVNYTNNMIKINICFTCVACNIIMTVPEISRFWEPKRLRSLNSSEICHYFHG